DGATFRKARGLEPLTRPEGRCASRGVCANRNENPSHDSSTFFESGEVVSQESVGAEGRVDRDDTLPELGDDFSVELDQLREVVEAPLGAHDFLGVTGVV